MISVEDLAVDLGGSRILEEVSFEVDAGEFVALVGPNGAGKTTLLRTVNGIVAPAAGTVRVDGDDVTGLSSRELARRVATVPQNTSVSFDFSVRDIVAMGRTPHRSRFSRSDDADVVERALERVGVADLADRPVGTTSGGERQRVLLARALAQETPVLALDEPTASLDIHHQVNTLELVRGLVDEGADDAAAEEVADEGSEEAPESPDSAGGRTALAAIHDLDLAARFCDALVVLSDGRVLAEGPPEEVLTEQVVETAFGGRSRVHRNPTTGTPSVTALGDHTGRHDDQS